MNLVKIGTKLSSYVKFFSISEAQIHGQADVGCVCTLEQNRIRILEGPLKIIFPNHGHNDKLFHFSYSQNNYAYTQKRQYN